MAVKENRSFEQLLEHAKLHKRLPMSDLELVRMELQKHSPSTDPYTLIHILGEAQDRQSAPIVEAYLEFEGTDDEEDALVRRLALQVLGRTWRLSRAFNIAVRMAFEDRSPYVRAAAATWIGELGCEFPEYRSIAAKKLLLGLDQKEPDEPEIWESFHTGLLELFDVPFSERPLPTRKLSQGDVRHDLVAKAKALAAAI